MIIDAHTHVFDKVHGKIREGATSDGKWGAVQCGDQRIQVFPPYLESTQFPVDALIKYMDIEKIDKAVLLQGCFYGDQNDAIKSAVKKYPQRFAAAMYLEPFSDTAMEDFEANASDFKALKLECSEPTGFTGWGMEINISDYIPLYRRMAKRDMVLVLDLGEVSTKSYQTDNVKKIIDAVPELKIVICHLGQPRPAYLEDEKLMRGWKAQIELANYGKVWLDTASLAAYFSREIYPYKSGALFFDIALSIASPSRIMAGTDMPGNSMIASYKQMLYLPRLYGSLLQLNDIELGAIMGKNAENVYFK